MTETCYYILAFSGTKEAIAGEAFAKKHLPCAIMPLPPQIDAGCGLALRFPHASEQEVLALCNIMPLNCTLYKLDTIRVNGKRNIVELCVNKVDKSTSTP